MASAAPARLSGGRRQLTDARHRCRKACRCLQGLSSRRQRCCCLHGSTGVPNAVAAARTQVRAAKGWAPEQCLRFLCAGRELFLDDGVAKAAAATVHCIASDGGARYSAAGKGGGTKPGEPTHAPTIDWVRLG